MKGSQRNRKQVMLYEVVTNDKWELPIFAGTMSEMVEFTGRNKNSIMSSISHDRKYHYKGRSWKTVKFKCVKAGLADAEVLR